MSDEQLSQTVQRENAGILGITGPPTETMIWKFPRALPQYASGHRQIISRIRKMLQQTPGLYSAISWMGDRSAIVRLLGFVQPTTCIII